MGSASTAFGETVRRWRDLRVQILEPHMVRQGGRVAEIAGDAVLVEFPSVVNAVRWAADVQRSNHQLSSESGRGDRCTGVVRSVLRISAADQSDRGLDAQADRAAALRLLRSQTPIRLANHSGAGGGEARARSIDQFA